MKLGSNQYFNLSDCVILRAKSIVVLPSKNILKRFSCAFAYFTKRAKPCVLSDVNIKFVSFYVASSDGTVQNTYIL